MEVRTTYDDDIAQVPVPGTKIYLEISRNDSTYGHYENLVDQDASMSLGEVHSISHSGSSRVAVAFPSAVRIFDLSRGSTMQEQLVYESDVDGPAYVLESGDHFLVGHESGTFDLIPMDPLETFNIGQATYLIDIGSNQFKSGFHKGKVIRLRAEDKEDYFLTDFKTVDDNGAPDWQGAKVQYWDQKARKLVAIGQVKSRIVDGVGGCQTRNHFLMGTTFMDKDDKERDGIFWIDADTHQFGEEPAPGPVIALCALFRHVITSKD